MTFLRKLELSGGAICAVTEIFVGLAFIRLDQKASERLGESAARSVIDLSLIYVLPAILVILGSFLHSVKGKKLGQLLLIVGSLANVGMFLLLFLSSVPVPYGRTDLFWLNFLSAASAIATSTISFFVKRQR